MNMNFRAREEIYDDVRWESFRSAFSVKSTENNNPQIIFASQPPTASAPHPASFSFPPAYFDGFHIRWVLPLASHDLGAKAVKKLSPIPFTPIEKRFLIVK